MKIFKNRIVVVLLAVLLVACSLVLSAGRGMKKDLRELEDSFFTAQNRGPLYYVDQIISAAASIATVADHYDALDASALRSARTDMVKAEGQQDIPGLYAAAEAVSEAVSKLDTAASGVELSAADRSTLADAVNTVSGARRELNECGYNERALALIEENYRHFPGSFLADLLNIAEPMLYGPEGN